MQHTNPTVHHDFSIRAIEFSGAGHCNAMGMAGVITTAGISGCGAAGTALGGTME